ncbi:MAG: ChbG/HpnK family deacetylase [Blastocatellia bacterium]
MVRKVIFNADDYGSCAEINAAIKELIEAGRLSDVSVLVTGRMWESSTAFLLKHPQVSAGVHLNAVEGQPVSASSEIRWITNADGQFPGLGGPRGLIARWIRHPLAVTRAVELEWRAQIERLYAVGLHLSHADSHQHLHAFPPAWHCAVKLCREYNIPSLRLPLEKNSLPLRRGGALALGASLFVAKLAASLDRDGDNDGKRLRHNDHFLGFKRAGAYGLKELIADLRIASPGVTEVALHPSTQDKSPYPGLLGNRERLALLDASLPNQLAAMGIEITTWKNIGKDITG